MFPDVVSFGVQPFPDIRFSKIACFLSCRVCAPGETEKNDLHGFFLLEC